MEKKGREDKKRAKRGERMGMARRAGMGRAKGRLKLEEKKAGE